MLTIAHHSCPIGDSLCALPAIREAAARLGPIRVWMKNRAVPLVMQSTARLTWLADEPAHADRYMHAYLGLGPATYHLHWHMRQAYYAQIGLPVPDFVPPFPVYVPIPQERTRCDVLVSPYSGSDCGHNKAWYTDRWGALLRLIESRGLHAGIIGAADQRNAPETVELRKALRGGFKFEKWGRPLAEAMAAIRDARVCVSIDNGVSHMISAMGRPHVLLYPACLPATWVRNTRGNAVHIIGQPSSITIAQVAEKIFSIIAVNAPGPAL